MTELSTLLTDGNSGIVHGTIVPVVGNRALPNLMPLDGNRFDPVAFPALAGLYPDHILPLDETGQKAIITEDSAQPELVEGGLVIPATDFDFSEVTAPVAGNYTYGAFNETGQKGVLVTSSIMYYTYDHGNTWTALNIDNELGIGTTSDNWSYLGGDVWWTQGSVGRGIIFDMRQDPPVRTLIISGFGVTGNTHAYLSSMGDGQGFGMTVNAVGNFVYTEDYGQTFNLLPTPSGLTNRFFRKMGWVEGNQRIIGASTATISYSDDRGITWGQFTWAEVGITANTVRGLWTAGNTIFISTQNGTSNTIDQPILRSDDGGDTWTADTFGLPLLAGSIAGWVRHMYGDGNGVWVATFNNRTTLPYISFDNGLTFRPLNASELPDGYDDGVDIGYRAILKQPEGDWIITTDRNRNSLRSSGGSAVRNLTQWQGV